MGWSGSIGNMTSPGDPALRPPAQTPAQQRFQRLVLFTSGVLLLFVGLLFFTAYRPVKAQPLPALKTTDYPLYGQRDAPVKVVVFEDFKCQHCATLHHELQEVLAEPLARGELSLGVLNFPFLGRDSSGAAAGAYCAWKLAGLQGFGRFREFLFAAQAGQDMRRPWITPQVIEEGARAARVEMSRFRECAVATATRAAVVSQAASFPQGRALGTPGVYVDGQYTRQTGADVLAAVTAALR